MTEEAKVVSLFDRQPYEAPEEPEDPSLPDQASADLLREVADRIERNEIKGVGVITWHPEAQTFHVFFQMPPGERPQEDAYRFVGGAEELKQMLLDFAITGDTYEKGELDDLE